MKKLRTILIGFLFLMNDNLNAQVYEFGLGAVKPIGYPNGINIHGFGGKKFGYNFVLGISADYLKLKSRKEYHQVIIDRGTWNRVKIHPDTFYNVEEKNSFSVFEMAIEPRFYSIDESSRFFFCPSIGIGFFQQTNFFSQLSKDYGEYGTFRTFNPFLGIEMGKEYPFKNNSKIAFQMGLSSKLYFGIGNSTDIYTAPFTQSKIIFKGRLGIVYRL